MKIFKIHKKQVLPIPLSKAWSFFSDPRNLSAITPAELCLEITEQTSKHTRNGVLIAYRMTPLFSIRMRWVTELKHVQPPCYFVDEQRFGPYKFWYHQHFFRTVPDGTEVED
ncbi:MAG: SRPBCC family protein, partial [Candidatus Omnitrophica bacterium]|nr:SRPBCC family protein [Candidatus Omnitrophota bacterium]